MRCHDGFARNLGAAALSIALVFATGAMSAVGPDQRDGAVVALAYDSGTDSLLKVSSHQLYRSRDSGRSWQTISIPSPEGGRIVAIAPSAAAKGTMYVVGPGLGVLRTDDGGKSWVARNEGLPSRDVIAVAAHTTLPGTVYAVVKERGIYRSQDGGKTWRLMDRSAQDGMRQLVHSNMAGSMQTGWLFAATPKGVRRIMDCFCLWQDAGKLATEASGVTYDPRKPEHIYAATGKGLFRSMDGGETWVAMTSPGANAVALASAPSGTLYVMDAAGRLFQSADQGKTWTPVNA